MPEGDTLHRIATALRPFFVGRAVNAASARQPGPRAELLVGARIEGIDSVGKHLLIRFDNGLELRTHLGMHGSWHRYSPGERWRRSPARARIVLEVPGAVAVCFDAPTVELSETRAEPLNPALASLGPDLLAPAFGEAELGAAIGRLRNRDATAAIAEALLDQRALAGIGNVYKSETLFVERVDPFAVVASLDDETLGRLIRTARRLLLSNLAGGPRVTTSERPEEARRIGRLWVYGRAGRPCRRCGTIVESIRHGRHDRRTFWCPGCQRVGEEPR